MISQAQADKATEICAAMLETIEKVQRDLARMKAASDEFERRMAERENAPQ